MKSRLFIGFAAAGCMLLASCYPYPEGPGNKKEEAVKKEPTLDELKAKKEAEAKKKAEEEVKEKKQEVTTTTTEEPAGTTGGATEENKPAADTTSSTDYPFANKVPGKDGFVFSPYNNKVVDVRDIPSGTLVMDPTYPPSDKKYFRVP